MFTILISLFYILILSLAMHSLMSGFLAPEKTQDIGLHGILGLVLLGTLGGFFQLFLPLESMAWSAVQSCILLVYLLKKFKPQSIKPLLPPFLLLLLCITAPIYRGWNHLDTGGYHLQTILWFLDESLPLGLANLHSRYGLNSFWHWVSSSCSIPGIKLSGSFTANGALLLFYTLHLFYLSRLKRKSESLFGISALCILAFFSVSRNHFTGFVSTPSTELPLEVFLLLTIEYSFLKLPNRLQKSILFSVVTVVTKPILLPALLFPIFAYSKKINLLRKKKPFLLFLILFIIVYITRSFLLSSCFFFPVQASCFPNLAYFGMPQSLIHSTYQEYLNYSRGTHLWGHETWSWVKNAFFHLFHDPEWIRFLIFLPFFIWLSWTHKKLKSLLVPFLVILSFWYWHGPVIRYAFGIIDAIFIFTIYLIINLLDKKNILFDYKKYFSVIFLLLFSFYSLRNAKGVKWVDFVENWPKLPTLSKGIYYKNNCGDQFFVPDDSLCWTQDKSCVPIAEEFVKKSSNGYRTTFEQDKNCRWTKVNDP